MKNKAIFVNNFAGGGAERVAHNLLLELSKEELIHIIFVTKKLDYPLPSNCTPFFLTDKTSLNRVFKLFYIPYFSILLRKYLVKNEINLVLSFMNFPNWIACFLKYLRWNGKVLISEQAAPLQEYKADTLSGKVGLYLISRLYSKSDIIIPCSKGVGQQLNKIIKLPHRYEVIYNPINLNLLEDIKNKTIPVKYDKFTFVNVAGFRQQKNHLLLVEAFSKLNDHNCQLILVGNEYSIGKKIRYRCEELGILGKVKFIGYTQNPLIYLLNADCFVLSSDYEGLPNVILEALYCNLPVISTDCPTGPREVLHPSSNIFDYLSNGYEIGEYGILSTVRDATSLTNAMLEILNNTDFLNKLRSNASESLIKYDLSNILYQYKNILNE